MSVRVLLSFLLCIFSLSVWAADPPAKTGTSSTSKPAAAPAAPAAGAKAQEFARLSKEFNDLIADLTAMQSEYSATGNAEKKKDIKEKFNAAREKATAMADRLVALAEEAYKEAPNANDEVTRVLVGTLVDRIASDDCEPAFALGKMLMDHNCPDAIVPALAGIAAYCVNEYDVAEPWLKTAAASGALNRVCEDIKKRQPDNPMYYQSFPYVIARTKAEWAKEKKIRAAEAEIDDLYAKAASDDKKKAELAKKINPRVLLKTSKGDIVIELFENEAPNTVLSFITLVDKGFYDGVAFHRVLPGFMAQGGDPKGTGAGGPGYTIPDECFTPNHRLHFRGSLSVAHRSDAQGVDIRDSGGSQFFMCFLPTSQLDGKYTVFGRVINTPDTDSFAVLAKLKRINPEVSTSASADKILEAKVLRKRSHPYDAKDVKKSSPHD